MELETLKDFGELLSTPQEPFKEWGTWNYIKRKLKQLAITHIKHMRREGRDFYAANIDEKSAIPKLMEIFNLNDEEVK